MDERVKRAAGNFAAAAGREDWDAALAAVDILVAAMPGEAPVHYNRGLVLRRLGRDGEAIAAFDAALTRDPAHANALFERSAAQMESGDLAASAEGFAVYLNRAPDDATARLNLGQVYTRLGRTADSVRELTIAHGTMQTDESAAALATALRDAGELDGCEALLALLTPGPENAALALKITTQGPRGRFRLRPGQAGPARNDLR